MNQIIGVFAIVPSDERVLLIERGIEPHFGHWCPPGGVIDYGESPEEAVIRETREETGLEVSVVEKLGEIVGPITGGRHGVYLCTPHGNILCPSPPETTDAKWVPLNDIHSFKVPLFVLEFFEGLDQNRIHRLVL